MNSTAGSEGRSSSAPSRRSGRPPAENRGRQSSPDGTRTVDPVLRCEYRRGCRADWTTLERVGPRAGPVWRVGGWVSGSGGGLRVTVWPSASSWRTSRWVRCSTEWWRASQSAAEGDAVADDVVVGDQDVVAGGADRFGVAAAAADLPVVGGEVGVLAAGGSAGAWGSETRFVFGERGRLVGR